LLLARIVCKWAFFRKIGGSKPSIVCIAISSYHISSKSIKRCSLASGFLLLARNQRPEASSQGLTPET
jgi:hypothetical protein